MKNKLGIIKTEKGATFVEIMLAVAILAIIAVPLLSTVIASVRNNATAKEKTEAIALAEMAMGNIKAQTNLSVTTPPSIYFDLSDKTFETLYAIEEIDKAEVVKDPNANYNYNNEVNKKFDFEFVINQSNLSSDSTVDITVKDSAGKEVGTIFDINTGSVPELKIEKSVPNYEFRLDYSGSSGVSKNFTPQYVINNNAQISFKVTYEGEYTLTGKSLKIDTYDNSPADDSLIIYFVDSSDGKLDIKFIPKGTKDSFILAYIVSDAFDDNSVINKLFKITVIIKRANDKKEIYRVSSYVKK